MRAVVANPSALVAAERRARSDAPYPSVVCATLASDVMLRVILEGARVSLEKTQNPVVTRGSGF